MEYETFIKDAENILKKWGKDFQHPEPNRLDVYLERTDLLAATQAIADAQWGYLSALSGLDCPAPKAAEGQIAEEGHLEALYHFCRMAAVTTLRVKIPYNDAHIPSICSVIPSATLYEREMMELFGIIVDDTPVRDRLVLADEWPEGIYPLRKTFTGLDVSEKGTQES
jgi:NADH:ubiquinone oxidoreductase subunit C